MSDPVFVISGNTGPPTFKVLNHIEVPNGGIATIEPTMFYISDPDTILEELLITLVTAPTNGVIVKVTDGLDAEVKVGDNVTIDDVINGKVMFFHEVGKLKRGLYIEHTSYIRNNKSISWSSKN